MTSRILMYLTAAVLGACAGAWILLDQPIMGALLGALGGLGLRKANRLWAL